MDQETIKLIADQISDQTILTSWKTWGLQFALWMVGTFGAAFAAAYLAKRGEHRAIKADFEELKNQLKENTFTVKAIETEFSHADWTAREWKTIRRIKLEELMQTLNEVADRTSPWMMLAMQRELEVNNAPLDQLQMIARLYLPELSITTQDVDQATRKFYASCRAAQTEIIKAAALSEGAAILCKVRVQKELLECYRELQHAVAKLRTEAPPLMLRVFEAATSDPTTEPSQHEEQPQ